MTLSIAGIGMVSPAGITARDHVFFTRAGVLTPAPSPFLDAQGQRVDVRYCPWIGARVGVGERLIRMAQIAVHEAASAFEETNPDERIPLLLCTSAPRPGLSKANVDALADALGQRLRSRVSHRFQGEAGVFAALHEAEGMLAARHDTRAVMVVGVDSYVSVEALTEMVRRPASYWSDEVAERSEGAAALLLTAHPAPHGAARPPATLHSVALASAAANDDNDAVVDGAGLTTAIRALRAPAPIGLALGQERIDELRRREWHLASARTQGRFLADCALETLERHLGRVGAASGAMSLAYGVALSTHQAVANRALRQAPFLAWAISRDGMRGAAVAQGTTR